MEYFCTPYDLTSTEMLGRRSVNGWVTGFCESGQSMKSVQEPPNPPAAGYTFGKNYILRILEITNSRQEGVFNALLIEPLEHCC